MQPFVGRHVNASSVMKVLLADERVDRRAGGNDNYAIRKASEKGRHNVVKMLLADERVDPAAKMIIRGFNLL